MMTGHPYPESTQVTSVGQAGSFQRRLKRRHTVGDLMGAAIPGRVQIIFTEPKKLFVKGPVNNCSCAGQCLPVVL